VHGVDGLHSGSPFAASGLIRKGYPPFMNGSYAGEFGLRASGADESGCSACVNWQVLGSIPGALMAFSWARVLPAIVVPH
jgi:hypothetical protein